MSKGQTHAEIVDWRSNVIIISCMEAMCLNTVRSSMARQTRHQILLG